MESIFLLSSLIICMFALFPRTFVFKENRNTIEFPHVRLNIGLKFMVSVVGIVWSSLFLLLCTFLVSLWVKCASCLTDKGLSCMSCFGQGNIVKVIVILVLNWGLKCFDKSLPEVLWSYPISWEKHTQGSNCFQAWIPKWEILRTHMNLTYYLKPNCSRELLMRSKCLLLQVSQIWGLFAIQSYCNNC